VRRFDESGLEKKDIIEATGYSRSTIDRIFDGETSPSFEQIYAITQALGTDPATVTRLAEAKLRRL
jgi:transcriptional regulator with XRE-family HTH domain